MSDSSHYSIKHITRFKYSTSVSESISEVRMQPLTDGQQVCRHFELTITPRAQVTAHSDHLGNIVHHFDIPGSHNQLIIGASSLVEVKNFPELPERLPQECWAELDEVVESEDLYEFLTPSKFAAPSELLHTFCRELGLCRRDDPLTVLRDLNKTIYDMFEYAPQATRVDSPIDHALMCRCGVCQDYSHVMITILRELLRVPSRYVSGYLFHRTDAQDRSATDATHAWIEAYLPRLGWVGFDPTNNLIAAERHIRVAIGRDYSDVPPTRGVFKGGATSELSVAVQVSPAEAPEADLKPITVSTWSPPVESTVSPLSQLEAHRQQQQQQQQ